MPFVLFSSVCYNYSSIWLGFLCLSLYKDAPYAPKRFTMLKFMLTTFWDIAFKVRLLIWSYVITNRDFSLFWFCWRCIVLCCCFDSKCILIWTLWDIQSFVCKNGETILLFSKNAIKFSTATHLYHCLERFWFKTQLKFNILFINQIERNNYFHRDI